VRIRRERNVCRAEQPYPCAVSQTVLALLAALLGAVAVIAGQTLNPLVTAHRAHRTWVRDKRAALCEQFVTLLEQAGREVREYEKTHPDASSRIPAPEALGRPLTPRESQDTSAAHLRKAHPERVETLLATANQLRIYGSRRLTDYLLVAVGSYEQWFEELFGLREPSSGSRGSDLRRDLDEVYEAVRRELGVD
jgi:hypothetical protein